MSEHYTIRRLKWVRCADGLRLAQTIDSRSYVVGPTDDAKWKAIVYPAVGLAANGIGSDYPTLSAAKAACWDDWVNRLEPALVRVRGSERGA
jgi:hypothetical protein